MSIHRQTSMRRNSDEDQRIANGNENQRDDQTKA